MWDLSNHSKSEVLTALLLKLQVFWDVTRCSWVISSGRVEGW